MRKRSAIVLAIMLIAFGALLAAAGTALKPLAEDAEAAKFLTKEFRARGDLEGETRIRLSRLQASEKRLAEEGRGLVIRLTPSRGVLERRGGLRFLALRLAQSGLSRFSSTRLDWVEICFEAGAENGLPEELKTLLRGSPGGQVGEPDPALPSRMAAGDRG